MPRSEDHRVQHAIDVIKDQYSVNVSVDYKKKDLLKFGTRTTVGTDWETLMSVLKPSGTQTKETFVTDNDITHLISSNSGDTGTVKVEYHTVDGNGDTTFGVQEVTLTGQTAAPLSTAAFRISRMYNTGSSALVGDIYAYEGGATTSGVPNTETEIHARIEAGEQQTQKGQTTVSSLDYWIITNLSVSVTEKTGAWVEARLESKPVAQAYWRPISQNFAATDSSGTTQLQKEPLLIVPANYDVRLVIRANAANVDVAGGFNGYLAKVIVEG